MYVYEEMIDGKKLTEIINETHENVKYLPGKKLPPNVVSIKIYHTLLVLLFVNMASFIAQHKYFRYNRYYIYQIAVTMICNIPMHKIVLIVWLYGIAKLFIRESRLR